MSLRVVFFGTPAFARPALERLLASAHRVAGVVTQPDRPAGRGRRVRPGPVKTVALEHGLPVLQPERLRDPAFLDAVRRLHPDVGVVAAYGRILPRELLELPRLGLINIHASLLPKYRGAAPVQRAVMAGEPETGVSIMRVVEALDAGPVLRTARRPIGPEETAEEIEADLAERGAALLVECLDDLAAGRAIETPQDHTQATYAPRLQKAEGLIDWSLPALVLHNRVRGLHPWPHAFTFLDGRRLLVRRTRPTDDPGAGAAPGTVVRAAGDDLVVAAGSGTALQLLEVQPEGRRPMTAREFLAGHPVQVGRRLG
ncbi:MAG TPA: methionyl-tRNA formyltransferase [Vicinamibacterales bacterium]|nr:methionyl-tRNA formyltransferase [Vicinamibacterales bacterium]